MQPLTQWITPPLYDVDEKLDAFIMSHGAESVTMMKNMGSFGNSAPYVCPESETTSREPPEETPWDDALTPVILLPAALTTAPLRSALKKSSADTDDHCVIIPDLPSFLGVIDMTLRLADCGLHADGIVRLFSDDHRMDVYVRLQSEADVLLALAHTGERWAKGESEAITVKRCSLSAFERAVESMKEHLETRRQDREAKAQGEEERPLEADEGAVARESPEEENREGERVLEIERRNEEKLGDVTEMVANKELVDGKEERKEAEAVAPVEEGDIVTAVSSSKTDDAAINVSNSNDMILFLLHDAVREAVGALLDGESLSSIELLKFVHRKTGALWRRERPGKDTLVSFVRELPGTIITPWWPRFGDKAYSHFHVKFSRKKKEKDARKRRDDDFDESSSAAAPPARKRKKAEEETPGEEAERRLREIVAASAPCKLIKIANDLSKSGKSWKSYDLGSIIPFLTKRNIARLDDNDYVHAVSAKVATRLAHQDTFTAKNSTSRKKLSIGGLSGPPYTTGEELSSETCIFATPATRSRAWVDREFVQKLAENLSVFGDVVHVEIVRKMGNLFAVKFSSAVSANKALEEGALSIGDLPLKFTRFVPLQERAGILPAVAIDEPTSHLQIKLKRERQPVQPVRHVELRNYVAAVPAVTHVELRASRQAELQSVLRVVEIQSPKHAKFGSPKHVELVRPAQRVERCRSPSSSSSARRRSRSRSRSPRKQSRPRSQSSRRLSRARSRSRSPRHGRQHRSGSRSRSPRSSRHSSRSSSRRDRSRD